MSALPEQQQSALRAIAERGSHYTGVNTNVGDALERRGLVTSFLWGGYALTDGGAVEALRLWREHAAWLDERGQAADHAARVIARLEADEVEAAGG